MGGYDGQAIAGVVATSTHGSGLGFGPFPDDVRVDRPRRVRRAARAPRAGRRRVRGRPCSMGCMGIVHSLELRVRPRFWLRERRVVRTWEEVRPELDDRLAAEEHFELFLNPYGGARGPRDDPHRGPRADEPVARRRRAPPADRDPGVDPARVALPAPRRAAGSRRSRARSSRARCGAWRTRTTRRSPTGSSTSAPPTTCPRCPASSRCPLEGDAHLRAVDRILEIADELRAVAPAVPHVAASHCASSPRRPRTRR